MDAKLGAAAVWAVTTQPGVPREMPERVMMVSFKPAGTYRRVWHSL